MIRLFKGKCVYIEQKTFNRDQIVEKYRSPKMHKETKFVITYNDRAVCIFDYRDILLKQNYRDNIRTHSKAIFEQAATYFQSLEYLYTGCCMGIIKSDGTLEYIVEYWDNTRFIEKNRQLHFYAFTDYKYPINFEDAQVKILLNTANCFVFEYMEEYTVHIAQVLLELNHRGANYKLYSLDEKVSHFFYANEIEKITSLSAVEKETKHIMVITGKYSDSPYKDTNKRTCYKSLELIMVFYEKAVAEKLKKNIDKPFAIIEDEYFKNGLVDLMKHNMAEYVLQEMKGNIPIINISKNNTYGELSSENVWDYYFNAMNEYSLDQAYASGKFRIISRELFTMERLQQEEFRRMEKELAYVEYMKKVQWRREILEYCESEQPSEFFTGKRILGVIARGTDWNIGIPLNINTGINRMIRITREELANHPYDFIYLATEDESNYCRYKREFGNLVLSSNQKRFNQEELLRYSGRWIAEIPRENDGFEYGLDYMLVIYCLSKCNSLITSMESGAYLAAAAMNKNKYERLIIGTDK